MLAALAVAATLASGCGPDYITQLPVICEQTARAPSTTTFPVSPDAEVSVYARWPNGWKPLALISRTSCVDTMRRDGVVARAYRCGDGLTVKVGRRSRTAPTKTHVQVAGSW